jgi:hypothetical protein
MLSQKRSDPTNKKDILITVPTKKPFKSIYQFKITLLETDPPIWRRIQVPEYYTFYELHLAIQNAMGWLDSHLHMFEVKDKRGRDGKMRLECPVCIEDISEEEFFLTTEVPIKRYFKKTGDRAYYVYDFGDNWEHDVSLEKILPKEPKRKYPICLDGKLACPPDDCGSIPGYYECVEAVKKRDNTEGLLTWLGRWKPYNFNPKLVKFENPRSRLKETLED